jgi:phage I-like protein
MHTLVPLKTFDDVATQESDNTYWIQAWRYSSWDHPEYGKIEITPEMGKDFKDHFQKKTYGQDLLANYEHGKDAAKGSKAAGTVLDIDVRDDSVFYKVEFTETALDEIKKGEWKYISPEYDDWTDAETGVTHKNVPMGVALTNRPFFKGMAPLNFSEHYSTIDDAKRADEFAQWEADKKEKQFAEWKKNSDDKKKEEEDSMNETLRKFAEKLGITITADDTEETILAKATELNDVIEPLRKAKDEGSKAKTFREAFPDEYEELQRGRAARIETDARKFAENFERFSNVKIVTKEDGTPETLIEDSKRGFSGKALKAIEDTHKKFSEGSASTEDLAELLKVLASDDAVVEFSETGSSRIPDIRERQEGKTPRMQFAEVVKEIQAKDSLDYKAALALAIEQEPELAAAYMGDRKEVTS